MKQEDAFTKQLFARTNVGVSDRSASSSPAPRHAPPRATTSSPSTRRKSHRTRRHAHPPPPSKTGARTMENRSQIRIGRNARLLLVLVSVLCLMAPCLGFLAPSTSSASSPSSSSSSSFLPSRPARAAAAAAASSAAISGQRRAHGRQQRQVMSLEWWNNPRALQRLLDPASVPLSATDRVKPTAAAPASGPSSSSWLDRFLPSAAYSMRDFKRVAFSVALPVLLSINGDSLFSGGLSHPPVAAAVDSVKVGKCLLQNCQLELARCILDPKCLANVICLNTCNNKPDEVGCQIGCGDLFENEVVGQFNACALSKKQCVPRKEDDGSYPVPADSTLVKSFDINSFKGRWYISAGLNPLFDIFDCQVHFFTVQGDKLYGKLNWRITEPDGEFFTRDTVQRFVQDPQFPGKLFNHDNEYLHYQDDWYILDHEPDQFIAIYYRGQNDAWTGYGGGVVYTRGSFVPPQYKERITAAFAKAGVDYGKFKEVDNTCSDQKESPTALRAEFARRLFLTEEQQLQEALTTARITAGNAILMEEKEAQAAVKELERAIYEFERGVEKEVIKDVKILEDEIEEVEKKVEKVIDTNLWKNNNRQNLDSLAQRLEGRPLADPRPAPK